MLVFRFYLLVFFLFIEFFLEWSLLLYAATTIILSYVVLWWKAVLKKVRTILYFRIVTRLVNIGYYRFHLKRSLFSLFGLEVIHPYHLNLIPWSNTYFF